MALESGTVAIHIPDSGFQNARCGSIKFDDPKSNSRISVTNGRYSSEPAHPSLFEKKTNSSASAGQTLEKNLDREIMLRVAVGESLARPSQLGRQVAHVLAEAAHFFRRLRNPWTDLDALGLGQLDSEHFSSRAGGAEHDTTEVPASAAPPASSGILALLTAWPVACPASFPAFPTASPTALAGLVFELPFREGLERALVRFARDCAAFGFRAPFAFAVFAVEVFQNWIVLFFWFSFSSEPYCFSPRQLDLWSAHFSQAIRDQKDPPERRSAWVSPQSETLVPITSDCTRSP